MECTKHIAVSVIRKSRWSGWFLAPLLIVLAGCPAGENNEDEAAGSASRSDRPASGDWISPREVQYYLNDSIEVEYMLYQPDPIGPAWIAMVPADTESLLAGDNFAAQVEYTLIHELPHGTAKFHARKNGEYILRLFASKRDSAGMIAQSDVLRIGTPAEEQRQLTPPYVTLSGFDLPEEIVLRPGMVIAAYWMLEDPPDPDAWLGLVPADCPSKDAAVNHDAALEVQALGGKTMAANRFLLKEPGAYVFRIFPSAEAGAVMICQSEEFTVIAEPPAGE